MNDEPDKLDRFKEAFERGEQGQVSDYRAWLENQGFQPERVNEDWLPNYFREHPEHAANHDEQLETVAEYLGFFSTKGGQRHLPIIGVSGIGKTVFLHTIHHAVDQLGLDIPVRFLDASTFDDVEDERFRLRIVQEELEEAGQIVILVDNCAQDRDIVESLSSIGEAAEEAVILSVWTPEWWRYHCEKVETRLPVTDEIHLEAFSESETRRAVDTMFELLSSGGTKPSSDFVSTVWENCFGNPNVMLKLVLRSLKEAFHAGTEVGTECVERAADTLGLVGAKEAVYDLPDSRLNMLAHMLRDTDERGTRPSDLVEDMGLDKSTVSYHLRELRQADIVESTKSGRRAYYQIREVAKPLAQMRITQQGEIHG